MGRLQAKEFWPQELLWLLKMHLELVLMTAVSPGDGTFGHWKCVFARKCASSCCGHESALFEYSGCWSYCSAPSCALPLGESILELLEPSQQG